MKDASCFGWDASTRLRMPAQRPHLAAIRLASQRLSARHSGYGAATYRPLPDLPMSAVEVRTLAQRGISSMVVERAAGLVIRSRVSGL